MDLLSYPSLVEAPFIIVKIGDFTFGQYERNGTYASGELNVTFPNFMQSLNVTKINGQVNVYTIKMVYGIREGDDPNLLEKVFSTVSKSRKIYISYGDWASPSDIFREEEAIITKISSSVDFSSSRITYTINCTSTSKLLMAGSYNFPARSSKKASDEIIDMYKNNAYGMQDVFTGMSNMSEDELRRLIRSDDKAIKIEGQQKTTVFNRLNYLVNSMTPIDAQDDSPLKGARYFLTVVDDILAASSKGPMFKVTKVDANIPTDNSLSTFEVDIGYPGSNFVTSFNISNDETYSILYDFSGKIDQSKYVYRIDNSGKIVDTVSPNITTSGYLQYSREIDKSWWTNMTQFPISATMTIKGLLRPAILMDYVKVNSWFYGSKHISSGLYIITKQDDTIDGNGYRTVLNLLRVGEDV